MAKYVKPIECFKDQWCDEDDGHVFPADIYCDWSTLMIQGLDAWCGTTIGEAIGEDDAKDN